MDTEIYNTKKEPVYVIQFEDNDGSYKDSSGPVFYTGDAAIAALKLQAATPYAQRVVRRVQ